jgi:hypothetical protein
MIRNLFISAIAIFVCQGCAVFVPQWKLRHAPTGANYATLADAQNYAATVADSIDSLNTELSIAKTTSNLLLMGTGMGTVAAAALRGSRDLLIGLGLASGGILTFQYASGISGKQAILDDARIAIACAQETALKISQPKTASSLSVSSGASALLALAPVAGGTGSQSAQRMERLANTLDSLAAVPPPAPGALAAPVPGPPVTPALRAPVSRLAAVVRDAAGSQQQALDSVQSALDATAMAAPAFLVFTVHHIELATSRLLHNEPEGKDILSFATDHAQTAVKAAKDAVESAKTTTQKSTATVKAAADVSTSTTDDMSQKAQIAQTASTAQSELANTDQKLSVIDAVLSDAANCKKLGQ